VKYNPSIHHRRSIRLKGYDYSTEGMYFITICTQNREALFGEIIDDKMVLNVAGDMIGKIFISLPDEFPQIVLNQYIIMPNHFHTIISITDRKYVGADSISAQNGNVQLRADIESAPTIPLGNIVQSFKRQTTIKYIHMVKQKLLPPFDKRIWQRNYHEHIIRNQDEYYRIAEYIQNNPMLWENDCYNNSVRKF
jgi:REP element-mobilizing transposase RayT